MIIVWAVQKNYVETVGYAFVSLLFRCDGVKNVTLGNAMGKASWVDGRNSRPGGESREEKRKQPSDAHGTGGARSTGRTSGKPYFCRHASF